MSDSKENDSKDEYEKAQQEAQDTRYVLKLYVAGNTQKSANAILTLRRMCDEYLKDRYELEVIDIYQQPDKARTEDIIATPTLVKALPLPIRRFIGDLTKTDRIKVKLNLVIDPTDGNA